MGESEALGERQAQATDKALGESVALGSESETQAAGEALAEGAGARSGEGGQGRGGGGMVSTTVTVTNRFWPENKKILPRQDFLLHLRTSGTPEGYR